VLSTEYNGRICAKLVRPPCEHMALGQAYLMCVQTTARCYVSLCFSSRSMHGS